MEKIMYEIGNGNFIAFKIPEKSLKIEEGFEEDESEFVEITLIE